MTMDASDRDYRINIKSSWGSDQVPVYGAYMPDGVASFMQGDDYYFVTANEGATRTA